MKLGIDGCEDLSGRGAFVHSDVEGMAAGRSGESASSITQSCQKYTALMKSSISVHHGRILNDNLYRLVFDKNVG